MFKKLPLAVAISSALILLGCEQGKVDQQDHYQGQTAKQMFTAAKAKQANKNYTKATKIYNALEAHFPLSKYTKQGLLNLVEMNFQKGDIEATDAAAEHFLMLYPTGNNAAYVNYTRAMVRIKEHGSWLQRKLKIPAEKFDIAELDRAFMILKQLSVRFPKSKYTTQATIVMRNIRNVKARHELAAAKFYSEQAAYLAAVNRAREAIALDASRSMQVQAYQVMLHAYKQLQDVEMTSKIKRALQQVQLRHS